MKHWTLADVAAHWDATPDYDDLNARIDSYMRRFFDSADLFSIPDTAHVLDVDCRTGNGTIFFHRRVPSAHFHCMAMARTFVERAQHHLAQHAIPAPIVQMTDPPWEFPDATFDVILCYETLEHVPWPDRFLAELARIVRPGGTLVLTTPNRLWEPVHWLSAALHIDHGEGPHRMLPRAEILRHLRNNGWLVRMERAFVIIPAGPSWLLKAGRMLESLCPERLKRMLCLRRTFICTMPAA